MHLSVLCVCVKHLVKVMILGVFVNVVCLWQHDLLNEIFASLGANTANS